MIISASRRTDIPALHSEWFMNRIREGYAITTHHPNSGKSYKVPLMPDVVDCIVFRTKNPAPMIPHLDALADYGLMFNITMNPYGREMEANVPPLRQRVETFRELSRMVGPERMVWRYDPLFLSPKYDLDFHRRAFEYLCRELEGQAEKAMIGFIIHHPFVARRIDSLGVKRRDDNDIRTIGAMFSGIASRHHIPLETCAERVDLDEFGIRHGACIEKAHVEKIIGCRLEGCKDKYLRPNCNCVESVDIGHYSTCDNGCLYCYATSDLPNINVDPRSPSLNPNFKLESLRPDSIVEMQCWSFKSKQRQLW